MAGKLLITPNAGSTTAGNDPKIQFQGTGNSTDITLRTTTDGSLSFEGASGQLFSISDSMSGTIFSANDVSGIPSIEVLDTGLVKLAQYSGNVVLGSATDDGINKLQVSGTIAATSFNSITALSSTTPAALGVAAVGTSTTVARSDHVHTLPSLVTIGATPTIVPVSAATYTGVATTGIVVILANTTSNSITVTLPTAVGSTAAYYIKKTIAANTLNINTTSSQTIDGSTTIAVVRQYESITVVSDGANWNII